MQAQFDCLQLNPYIQMMTPIMDCLAAIMISHGIPYESFTDYHDEDQREISVVYSKLKLVCLATIEGEIHIDLLDRANDSMPIIHIVMNPIRSCHTYQECGSPRDAEDDPWYDQLIQSLGQLKIAPSMGEDDDHVIGIDTVFVILGLMTQAVVNHKNSYR